MSAHSTPGILRQPLFIDGLVLFNSLNREDQEDVVRLHHSKMKNGEIAPEVPEVVGIEQVAIAYKSQREAFEEVLADEGFEIVNSVPMIYPGSIAVLTNSMTLVLCGSYNPDGRLLTSSRITRPDYTVTDELGHLHSDLRAGERPAIGRFIYSPARSLAVNSDGTKADSLDESRMLSQSVAASQAIKMSQYEALEPINIRDVESDVKPSVHISRD